MTCSGLPASLALNSVVADTEVRAGFLRGIPHRPRARAARELLSRFVPARTRVQQGEMNDHTTQIRSNSVACAVFSCEPDGCARKLRRLAWISSKPVTTR